jgi:mRNA-degrading endonuclease HigB of HigAB toxin-antitoxin module
LYITKLTDDVKKLIATGNCPAIQSYALWLEEAKNKVWKSFDDIQEQYANCVELASNEVIFNFDDSGLTIEAIVEYSNERVFIQSVVVRQTTKMAQ